jgi:uncharacterized integral membrane protein
MPGMAEPAGPASSSKPARKRSASPDRKQQVRIAGAGLGGALITVFAIANLDEVEVNWVFGTWSTPLILVVVLCFAAGMAVDRLLIRRRRSR